MTSDVRAKTMTATGQAGLTGYGATDRTRIKSLSFLPVAAGAIVIRDGSASGAVVLDLAVSADSNSALHIPGCGILCQGDPHVTLTAVTSVTIFYG